MRGGSQDRLDREIELLRERLEGAEEMRRALVSEELDGFVVGDATREPRVVLLETSALATGPLLERLPHGAVTVSPSGEILYANQRFADYVGRSLAGLFSASMANILAPESRAPFEAHLRAAASDRVLDVALIHRSGRKLAARVTTVAIGNGHLSLLVTELQSPEIADDAHEAVRAIHSGEIDGVVVGGDEVMLVSHAQHAYRALVDRMPQGAVTVSGGGDVLYANNRFAAMVGRSRDSLLGQPLRSVLGSEEIDQVLRSGRGPVSPSELTLVHADGGPVRVAITTERVDGVDALTLVLSDLTERDRHLEMQERAKRNDRFLAVLAHELRNPLGAIRNAVEILVRSGAMAQGQRFAIDVIGRQSETLVRLVDDLLDVHRLNADKIVLRREPVDMREVIERAVEAARPSFGAKKQTIEVRMSDGAVYADADVVRLAQVLGNVLVNASKFTPAGGQVDIVLDRAASGAGAEVARIRVTDNGIGMPGHLLDKVFEPYVQVPHDGREFPEGLGLGLSVARRLVHLHGGTIEAQSVGIGHGTTFIVELPTCAAPTADAGEREIEAPPTQGVRILIADDDEDSRTSLAQLLQLLGHRTYTARNGVEAVALADEVRPDVVILDLGMPHLDGWSAARALRRRAWADGLILYALTGWSQPQALDETREAGFDAHFAKPAAFDALVRDLHQRVLQRLA